jgi:hypothetical protein
MGLQILGDLVDPPSGAYGDAIFVKESEWGPSLSVTSEATLVPADLRDTARPTGMKYLLEIGIVRELVEDYEAALARPLTRTEKVRSIVYYAVHDAPLDPKDVPDRSA